MSDNNNPQSAPAAVTVVTVVRNAKDDLRRTVKSVIRQTYSPIEYIIIDGGSTDGTLDIIRQFEEHIAYWSSGNDSGVYDGMNKAIERASGEWIIFMNAGDWFCDADVIRRVFSNYPRDTDFIYGDYIFVFPNWQLKAIKAQPINSLWRKMPFSHQALFTRTEVMKKHKFDQHYKIAADYNFIFRAYSDARTFFHTDNYVCVYSDNGLSVKRKFRSMLERWQIARKYAGKNKFKVDKYHMRMLLNNIFKKRNRIGNKYIWEGWYGIERYNSGWLRWTKKSGTILVPVKHDTLCHLHMELNSYPKGNVVEIRLNGKLAAAVKVDWVKFKAIPPVPLQLNEGTNRLEFFSKKEPRTPPGQKRALAIAAKNLIIK